MHRGYLDGDRLLVSRLLDGVDELAQVLDGVYVVLRGRAERVGAHRYHARPGDLERYLFSGQMAAYAGLGALPYLDVDGHSGVEVLGVYAEPAGRDPHYNIRPIGDKVLVKASLSRGHHFAAL